MFSSSMGEFRNSFINNRQQRKVDAEKEKKLFMKYFIHLFMILCHYEQPINNTFSPAVDFSETKTSQYCFSVKHNAQRIGFMLLGSHRKVKNEKCFGFILKSF